MGAASTLGAGARASGARDPPTPNPTCPTRRAEPCGSWSPAARGSSARPWSIGCSPRAATSTPSTTCRPARSRNLTDARAQRSRKFSFHRLDVRSPQLADLVAHRRPEVIFHLAAQLDVRVSVAKPLFDAEVNVLGSLNVCEAALAAGTRKVVFAGSGGTLYGVPESLPVRESHPQRPISPYGVSKKAAGDYLHYYREVHGLEYTELALANVYGPRQDPQRRSRGRRDLRRPDARRPPADDLRRRRADPRLRVRRRRRRRVRARHREGRRAPHEHRDRRRDERARALRGHGPAHRVRPGAQPRAGTSGRAPAVVARSRARRDPPRLEAVDRARRRPAAHHRLVPHRATPDASADLRQQTCGSRRGAPAVADDRRRRDRGRRPPPWRGGATRDRGRARHAPLRGRRSVPPPSTTRTRRRPRRP